MPDDLYRLDERTIPLIDFLVERVHEADTAASADSQTGFCSRVVRDKSKTIRHYWSTTEKAARATGLHRLCLVLLARYNAFLLRIAVRRYQHHPDFDRSWLNRLFVIK